MENIFGTFKTRKLRKNSIKNLLISSIFLCSISSLAAENIQIGRYQTVADKPKTAQIDLLSQIIQMRFPQNVQTVGDAMNYSLRLSGYSLVAVDEMNSSFKSTLSKPLPAIDRNFGPMPLKDALITLAGPAFNLIQDPLNRTVNFRVKPQFTRLAEKQPSATQVNS